MIASLLSPSGEPSVQDALWHVATSDNSGQVDMRYVFDVFVNGQQLVRSKVFPDPSTSKGYFDAGSIVRNEFTYEWFVPEQPLPNNSYLALPNDSGEISLNYDIRVGEDYSGITTTNMASGTTQVFNWRPDLFKRRQQDLTRFSNKFLSNRPRKARAGLNEKLMIPIRTDAALKIKCNTYGFGNQLIETREQSGTYSNNGFVQLDIGSYALNATIGAEMVNENVKYYDVWFNDFEKQRVYMDCNPLFTPVLLHFINQYGMYETARFGLASKLSMDVERKTFTKPDYRLGSSVTYYNENNIYHETKINYGSKSDWIYKLTMDCPTDAEYVWLEELIMSPKIYLEKDSSYYPVTLRTSNYERSTNQTSGLKPLEVEVELNQTRYGFRR